MTDEPDTTCPECQGFGIVQDETACGDPEHCSPFCPCPNGCSEPDDE